MPLTWPKTPVTTLDVFYHSWNEVRQQMDIRASILNDRHRCHQLQCVHGLVMHQLQHWILSIRHNMPRMVRLLLSIFRWRRCDDFITLSLIEVMNILYNSFEIDWVFITFSPSACTACTTSSVCQSCSTGYYLSGSSCPACRLQYYYALSSHYWTSFQVPLAAQHARHHRYVNLALRLCWYVSIASYGFDISLQGALSIRLQLYYM